MCRFIIGCSFTFSRVFFPPNTPFPCIFVADYVSPPPHPGLRPPCHPWTPQTFQSPPRSIPQHLFFLYWFCIFPPDHYYPLLRSVPVQCFCIYFCNPPPPFLACTSPPHFPPLFGQQRLTNPVPPPPIFFPAGTPH